MSIRNLVSIAVLAAGLTQLAARAPVPRASAELQFRDASEREMALSTFKGKVVLVEFLLTNCQHCSQVAQMVNGLYRDLGPRGFQPLGIAFENNMSGSVAASFAQDAKLAFPVGYASPDSVDAYLGRAANERFGVPQIVLIDRHGIVRAQSQPVGEPVLANEAYLRKLVNSLLQEGEPSWTPGISGISSTAALVVVGCLLGWRWKQKRQMSDVVHSNRGLRMLSGSRGHGHAGGRS